MDEKGKWASRVKEGERTVVVDLVETFFTNVTTAAVCITRVNCFTRVLLVLLLI